MALPVWRQKGHVLGSWAGSHKAGRPISQYSYGTGADAGRRNQVLYKKVLVTNRAQNNSLRAWLLQV